MFVAGPPTPAVTPMTPPISLLCESRYGSTRGPIALTASLPSAAARARCHRSRFAEYSLRGVLTGMAYLQFADQTLHLGLLKQQRRESHRLVRHPDPPTTDDRRTVSVPPRVPLALPSPWRAAVHSGLGAGAARSSGARTSGSGTFGL